MFFRRLRRNRNRESSSSTPSSSSSLSPQQLQQLLLLLQDTTTHSASNDDDNNKNKNTKNTDSIINSLLHLRLRQVDTNHDTCHICCDAHQVGNVVTSLPCGHMYHSECIVNWLERRGTCPVCRLEVTKENAGTSGCGRNGSGSGCPSNTISSSSSGCLLNDKRRRVLEEGDENMALVARALLFHHDQLKGYDDANNDYDYEDIDDDDDNSLPPDYISSATNSRSGRRDGGEFKNGEDEEDLDFLL